VAGQGEPHGLTFATLDLLPPLSSCRVTSQSSLVGLGKLHLTALQQPPPGYQHDHIVHRQVAPPPPSVTHSHGYSCKHLAQQQLSVNGRYRCGLSGRRGTLVVEVVNGVVQVGLRHQ